jgi:sarcosine oxidase subunit gamma
VSAPEPPAADNAGVTVAEVSADLIEVAPYRERLQVLKALAARRGLTLPAPGRVAGARDTLMLCVRPQRWLFLSPSTAAGLAATHWQEASAGVAAALDLSSALLALHVAGPKARDALARGCRLDLHPAAFPSGTTAATLIAQVSAIIAALPSGFLLLTPATTGRHFRDWLSAAARPFGFAPPTNVTVAVLSGELST